MKLFETKIDKNSLEKINEVLLSGELGFGSNVPKFEDRFSSFSGKKNNIATNSASASAFMIFSFLKEKYGVCDVYTTSLGFTSPAWSAKHFGHNIIFVDVNEDLQFDVFDYESRVNLSHSNNQIVVMPVLYGGVSTIKNFKYLYQNKKNSEIVIVDSAHCVTPTIDSDFVFFSFHPYKPICTSDGGMISTDDDEAHIYFKNYRNFGRTSKGLTYDITSEGFKFYMNNLNATIGLTQIDQYYKNLEIRKTNFDILNNRYDLFYHDDKSSFYFATTLVDNAENIIKKIGLVRNYPMLHKMTYYNNNQTLKKLELLHNKILNLPLCYQFSERILK
jgi:perosamine synthetase